MLVRPTGPAQSSQPPFSPLACSTVGHVYPHGGTDTFRPFGCDQVLPCSCISVGPLCGSSLALAVAAPVDSLMGALVLNGEVDPNNQLPTVSD